VLFRCPNAKYPSRGGARSPMRHTLLHACTPRSRTPRTAMAQQVRATSPRAPSPAPLRRTCARGILQSETFAFRQSAQSTGNGQFCGIAPKNADEALSRAASRSMTKDARYTRACTNNRPHRAKAFARVCDG
jgi:hypothetical protein